MEGCIGSTVRDYSTEREKRKVDEKTKGALLVRMVEYRKSGRFVFVDGELDKRRQRAGVASSQTI